MCAQAKPLPVMLTLSFQSQTMRVKQILAMFSIPANIRLVVSLIAISLVVVEVDYAGLKRVTINSMLYT